MSTTQNFINRVLTYYPATLSTGKVWFVRYYVYNPYSDKMELKRIKLNRINPIAERRRYARILINSLNAKLESGWNPFTEKESAKEFHKLLDVIETYKNAKFKELEKNSVRSYESFILKFSEYIKKLNPDIFCGAYTKRLASDFMLHIKEDVNVSNRTYNNHLLFYRRLFRWMMDYAYIPENPFENIQLVSKKFIKKTKKALSRDEIRKLIKLIEVEQPRFLAACMLEYYCLLRPDDLQSLKCTSFDLKRHVIFVGEDDTKNDHSSFRVIPLALEKYLVPLKLEKTNPNDYIFSDRFNFDSGTTMIDARYFAKYWDAVIRKKLNWGLDLKFYGLKYSGVTYLMEDGISPVYVQGQADHSSLEITNMYAESKLPEGFEQIRHLAKPV